MSIFLFATGVRFIATIVSFVSIAARTSPVSITSSVSTVSVAFVPAPFDIFVHYHPFLLIYHLNFAVVLFVARLKVHDAFVPIIEVDNFVENQLGESFIPKGLHVYKVHPLRHHAQAFRDPATFNHFFRQELLW